MKLATKTVIEYFSDIAEDVVLETEMILLVLDPSADLKIKEQNIQIK